MNSNCKITKNKNDQIILPHNKQYQGIKLKETKLLWNLKALKKKIKTLSIEQFNITKISILLKFIGKLNELSIKIPKTFFQELEKNSKIWKHKGPKKNTILSKERRHHYTWFQSTLQSHSNQNTTVLAQKETHIPMKQKAEPRDKPMKLQSTSSCKGTKDTHCRKDILIRKRCWGMWISTCQKTELSLLPCIKINSNG